MLDHLEDNIHRVIADIRPQMLEKIIENWTSRLDYIRDSRGSPMPEIIFKIYPGVEKLETEATCTSVQNSSICPETIVKSPLLCTRVAFDNFDRFVETKSGKDTLHDTVGIVYQNVDLHTPNKSQLVNLFTVNIEETVISKKRRRRTFEAITVDMQEEPVAKRKKELSGFVSSLCCFGNYETKQENLRREVDTKDTDEDNEDIQYQHWIDDEISIFNNDDNED
ncbi:hypothetical protein TNCV_245821 [Trichonephila clavipes]|nr:hypothetical protein TNCV_245821 [Trichonephila clavipes]